MTKELCPECGLPYAECNALAVGRNEAEKYLRSEGYSGIDARATAGRLIPWPAPIYYNANVLGCSPGEVITIVPRGTYYP